MECQLNKETWVVTPLWVRAASAGWPGYIVLSRDVAEAKKGVTPTLVCAALASDPELHCLIEGCS